MRATAAAVGLGAAHRGAWGSGRLHRACPRHRRGARGLPHSLGGPSPGEVEVLNVTTDKLLKYAGKSEMDEDHKSQGWISNLHDFNLLPKK